MENSNDINQYQPVDESFSNVSNPFAPVVIEDKVISQKKFPIVITVVSILILSVVSVAGVYGYTRFQKKLNTSTPPENQSGEMTPLSAESTPFVSTDAAVPLQNSLKPTPSATPKPTPKPTQKPTSTPIPDSTPTPRAPHPPVVNIIYPTNGQAIGFTVPGQTLCVGEARLEGMSGLQRKQNVNGAGWTSFENHTTLCFEPLEGANHLELQYRNTEGDVSQVYVRDFNVHKTYGISVTLNGLLYRDINCNGIQDSGEEGIETSATVNFFKIPEHYVNGSVSTDSNGSYSYTETISNEGSLTIQPSPVSPSGYTSNPKYVAPIVVLNSDIRSDTVNIPQVPNEFHDACQ